MNRRHVLPTLLAGGFAAAQTNSKVTKYCRFQKGSLIALGIIDGANVRQLNSNILFAIRQPDRHDAQAELT